MTSFAANEGRFANGIGESGAVAELDAGSGPEAVSAGGTPLEGAVLKQPPANASTLFPLVQLSSNALLPVAATQSCSPNAPSQRRLLRPNPHRIPHRAHCTAAAHYRDFVPWRFSDACRRRAWMAASCRRPRNLHMSRHW